MMGKTQSLIWSQMSLTSEQASDKQACWRVCDAHLVVNSTCGVGAEGFKNKIITKLHVRPNPTLLSNNTFAIHFVATWNSCTHSSSAET